MINIMKGTKDLLPQESYKWAKIEEEIAGSRRYYNGVVNKYNTKTEMFPSSIVAGMFGFARKPLYEVNSEAERENVTVSF